MSKRNKRLYGKPLTNILDVSEEEVMDIMAELGGLRHKYPNMQGFVAMNVGSLLDLCYCKHGDEWCYMTGLDVRECGESYLSKEKSCDAFGSYLVARYSECMYTAKKCVLNKQLDLVVQSVAGICSGEDARILQRMYYDLQGRPIWLSRANRKSINTN